MDQEAVEPVEVVGGSDEQESSRAIRDCGPAGPGLVSADAGQVIRWRVER